MWWRLLLGSASSSSVLPSLASRGLPSSLALRSRGFAAQAQHELQQQLQQQQQQHAAPAAQSLARRLGTALKWTAGAALVGVVGQAVVGDGGVERVKQRLLLSYLIPVRLARDVWTAAAIVIDYKRHLRPGLEGAERERVLQELHQRGADRLLQLCFANGGIYVKLGQHVGQLDHILPDAYVSTMRSHLLDRCPVSSYAEVRAIIAQDLGDAPERLFRHFSPNPIASASLAQVHVAEDHKGHKLAVKVQHGGLRESSAADIATVEALVHAVKWVFPDFDYQWLVEEIKTNLPRELDFTHEAANAERCRANLRSKRSTVGNRVHIPHIHHDKTAPRVLTMEFVEGAQVTDLAALRRMGVSPAQLSRLISETFNEMIFIHGDVHADPHAANMLVRCKNGRLQLVLLDHGLYRVIDDAFRLEYARLWRALVFGDEAGIERSSRAMNAGDMVPLFAGMLTQRPWDEVVKGSDVNHLTVPTTREGKVMLQRYAAQYAAEIGQMLLRIPRELLLLLKTNDCLRSVDNCLGQPVNNIVVTARECTRALAEQRVAEAKPGLRRWLTRLSTRLEVLHVEALVAGLHALMWLSWAKRAVGLGPRAPAATWGDDERDEEEGEEEAQAGAA